MVMFMETFAELNMVLLLMGIQEIANAHTPLVTKQVLIWH